MITPPAATTVLTVPSTPTRRTALNRSATSNAPCASKASATGVSKRGGARAIGKARPVTPARVRTLPSVPITRMRSLNVSAT